MIPAVCYHENRTSIDFTKDDQPHTVSLLPYLRYPSDAVGVVYECRNFAPWEEGRRRIGTGGETVDFLHEGILHHIDRLDGASKEVTLLGEDAYIEVCIAAELVGPGVVMHASKIDVSPTGGGEVNTWTNRSLTLEGGDQASDVAGVLLAFRAYDLASGGGDFGFRALGAFSSKLWHTIYHSCNFFYPCFIGNPGVYQLYIEGKSSPFEYYVKAWEIGYIKKGYGFECVVEYFYGVSSPSPASDWTTTTIQSVVPSRGKGAFVAQDLVPLEDQTTPHGTRSIGSTNDYGINPITDGGASDSACPVKLDESHQYEYMAVCDSQDLLPLAFTTVADGSASDSAKAVCSATGTCLVPASASAGAKAVCNVAAIIATRGTASSVARLSASATATLPAILSADIVVESVLSGEVAAGSAISGELDAASVMSGDADAGTVISGEIVAGSAISGTPAMSSG